MRVECGGRDHMNSLIYLLARVYLTNDSKGNRKSPNVSSYYFVRFCGTYALSLLSSQTTTVIIFIHLFVYGLRAQYNLP